MDIHLQALSGGTVSINVSDIGVLRGALRGGVLLPSEPGYDAARAIWNAMIDRRPGMIVQALGAADVMQAVTFAREHGVVLSVRGGGHNIAGNAVCEGGLMLDLSRMRAVRVDAAARRVRVEGGALLCDVDKETQAFGLAVPVGINSTTGIAGLTLGGGFGWTSRTFGLPRRSARSASPSSISSARISSSPGRLHSIRCSARVPATTGRATTSSS